MLSNVSLAPADAPPQSILVSSATMKWIGSSRDQDGAIPTDAPPPPGGRSHNVWLACGHRAGAVVLPAGVGPDALQLQQLVLWQLPQVGAA
jgi:hypothetical protein